MNIKNRLILVEGIPGSGKTTTANKIKNYLEKKGFVVKAFEEGSAHPADMAWQAYLTKDEFNDLLMKHQVIREELLKLAEDDGNHVIIPYLGLGLGKNERELFSFFENHEVYDARVSLETFTNLHLKRWKQFAHNRDKDCIYIFECATLQNHVNELLLHYHKDKDFIISYMKALISTVKALNPKLIYLSGEDIRKTITDVAKERVSKDDLYPDWVDRVIGYINNSLYGKMHQLHGFSGMIEFFEYRKKLELEILRSLSIDYKVIENRGNWEEVYNQIMEYLIV